MTDSIVLSPTPLLAITSEPERKQLAIHATARITVERADRIAVALGRHPAQIWGDEWWRASRETWEMRSMWPTRPLLDAGFSLPRMGAAIGRRIGQNGTLTRRTAIEICEALGVDPGDIWAEWHWVGP